jgi:hypothetical protein
MKKLVLALLVLVLMCGCGSRAPSPLIVVSINPAVPPNIDQGQTLQFTASLADNANLATHGVTWSATGPGCSGSACGTFTLVTSTSATYVAPASPSSNLSVSVTATSVDQPAQSSSAMFSVMVPPSITTTSLLTATPNYLYSATLQATGGVQPLKWSLAGGTLPAGLSLNSAGTIYGTPTTGGTSNFTLKVTDSSGAPGGGLSTQQALSLTVASVLTVPTILLPLGTLGAAYSASLPHTGGLSPIVWSLYLGSLPPGLVLQTGTGVISGTPTAQGTYSFTVEAFDSSPTQQTYISAPFTITILPSGPLTIRTTSLLDGTVGTGYYGQLAATGGTQPFVWSISSGALPTGLALNGTTGTITGVPTAAAGTYSFTAKVTDASSPVETSTQPLSITVNAQAAACSSSGSNSLLVGQYAFSLRGYNGAGFLAVVGSFTADGSGHITGGEADTNGVLGAQTGNLITSASSYSVGADNRGCATFATPFGTFYTRFALGTFSAGVATAGRIIEFDNPGATAYIAAGQIFQQTATAFLSPLTGNYALRTSGWDSTTSSRFACVGVVTTGSFRFNYLQQDCNDDGAVTNTTNTFSLTNTLVDTYTTADQNGRGTGIITVNQNISGLTFYWVSLTQLLVINSDAGLTFGGDWSLVQEPIGSPSFKQSSFSGTVASYSTGIGLSGAGGDVSLAPETADGVSSVTVRLYRDITGAWQTPNPTISTCNYSAVAIGRLTLGSGCGATPPIAYLNALNTADVLGTDSAIELGYFEPQTTGLTDAAIAGTYFVGTSEVVNQAAPAEVGIVTLTSNGIVTSTTDTASTITQTDGAFGSDTYSLNSDGTINTGSSGGNVAGMAISSGKFVIVSNPTITYPTLLIGQQ